jgi:hypothetical protein
MREIEERHNELIIPKPATNIPATGYKSRIRGGIKLRKTVVYSEILNRTYT